MQQRHATSEGGTLVVHSSALCVYGRKTQQTRLRLKFLFTDHHRPQLYCVCCSLLCHQRPLDVFFLNQKDGKGKKTTSDNPSDSLSIMVRREMHKTQYLVRQLC